jgi:hypothetical protein
MRCSLEPTGPIAAAIGFAVENAWLGLPARPGKGKAAELDGFGGRAPTAKVQQPRGAKMNWVRFIVVVVVASVIASFTDWFFMGMLFHDRYLATPELWRTGQSEGMKIGLSSLYGVLTCGGFAWLQNRFGATEMKAGLIAAVVAWIALPVPILAQFVLWTKLDEMVGVAQAFGWLVRLAITAVTVSLLMKPGPGNAAATAAA